MSLLRLLKVIYPNIFCFIYILLIALQMDYYHDAVWLSMEISCYLLLFSRAKTIYQSFRLTNFALSYEYQLKSIDLVINLSIISHLIVALSLLRRSFSTQSPSSRQETLGSVRSV